MILKHLSVTLQNVFHLLRLPGVSENTDGKAVKAGAIAILSDIDNSIRTLLSSAFAPPTAATA